VVCERGDDGRTEKHILDIRKLLATYCKGPYSEEITKFAPILRSGGKFRKFNFEANQASESESVNTRTCIGTNPEGAAFV
jgi:hypothetical protein